MKMSELPLYTTAWVNVMYLFSIFIFQNEGKSEEQCKNGKLFGDLIAGAVASN